jgi:hypothetical protein
LKQLALDARLRGNDEEKNSKQTLKKAEAPRPAPSNPYKRSSRKPA